MAVSLSAHGVSYAYVPGRPVLRGVSVSLEAGETAFLLGPNGGGKTTLIECLSGIRAPGGGEITVDGEPILVLPPRERARRIGYVPQFHEIAFSYTVWDMVLMGRAPYVPWLGRPGRDDEAAAARALEALGLGPLRGRPYFTLSGGERRLALVARGLAQGARYLLLDEPDAHLDPANQHRVLTAVRELAAGGLGVAASSHNPNNALLYGDRVAVLAQGELLTVGAPASVLTKELLSQAYGIPFRVITDRDGPVAILPQVAASAGEGRRALT
ncbi:MAG: ABC transporter ATP-binding protein [Candidatus Bipolaricaulota bacterium]